MSPAFYSLGLILTGRISPETDTRPLGALDMLAQAIADEEQEPHPIVTYVYGSQK